MGVSLCRLHVPSAFGGNAGFDVDTSHIFPQGVLLDITLVGNVVVMEELEPRQDNKAGLPLCSVTIAVLSGVGSAPKLLE